MQSWGMFLERIQIVMAMVVPARQLKVAFIVFVWYGLDSKKTLQVMHLCLSILVVRYHIRRAFVPWNWVEILITFRLRDFQLVLFMEPT